MKRIRSCFKMHGGKYYLANWIVAHFPKNYETMPYVECCGGAANVLAAKTPSASETYVDLDPSIVNVFLMLKGRFDEFRKVIEKTEYSEATFNHAKSIPFEMGSLWSAWAELCVRRMSRGGMRKAFAWSKRLRGGRPGDENAWETFKNDLPQIHDRFKNVNFIMGDAVEAIRDFNRPDTLLYCLHPDTPVRKEDESLVPINRIKVGDRLHGGRTVLDTMAVYYNGEMLNFRIQGMTDELCVTPDHRILVVPGHIGRQEKRRPEEMWRSRKLIRADQVSVNDYLIVPHGGYEVETQWEWQNNGSLPGGRRKALGFRPGEELFRFLGYYAAEGHTAKQKKRPRAAVFSFNTDELGTWVSDTVHCAAFTFGCGSVVREGPAPANRDCVRQIFVNSTSVVELVDRYVPGTATTKRLSQEIMVAPVQLQLQLLMAWIRGDGGLELSSRNRTKLCGTTSSRQLYEQLYAIALRCGLKPSGKQRGNNWDIYFASEDAEKLGFVTNAKAFRSTRRVFDGHMFSRVRKISKSQYAGFVWDLNVDEDDLFVANNCLVSNCDPPYLAKTRTAPNVYQIEMTEQQHVDIYHALTEFKGKAVISGYMSDLYKKLYQGWNLVCREVANNSGQGKKKQKRVECIWTNY